MTVLRAPFSAGLPGSHPGLSRSLSWAVILRFDVCFRASSVKLIYRCQYVLLLPVCQLRCPARRHHRKKTIQSP